MPSLDTIKTIRIKGETDGVDAATAAVNRLTASIQAANDNLNRSDAAARQADGWSIASEGALSAANHLRQAAEAAYAFSPAFRGVVNELAVPVLQGAGTALTLVAGGIVTATNVAGTGVIRLGSAVETTFPVLAGLGVALKSAGGWMEAFSPSVTSVAGTILAQLLPALRLLGPALLVVDAVKLLTEAWDLGNKTLAEYVELSQKAVTLGVSTEFYQRIAKAATDAKIPVDQLTSALAKLQQATTEQLGGTQAQNRLQDLIKAGNFGGNSGVAALAGADTTEAKFRAITELIDQAIAKGQRLAALDVAKTFLGDQVAANLARDSGYLDAMLDAADAIAAKDLVSQASVDNAVALQNRLEAAEQILSQRWHPVQDLLVQLGIKMKETWVDIVEAIANAVDAVFKLGQKIADMLGPMLDFIRTAEGLLGKALQFAGNAAGPAGVPIAAAGRIVSGLSEQPTSQDALGAAKQNLTSRFGNPANVSAAADQANAIQNKIWGDSSKDPAKQVTDTTAAYDRATESLLKYIATTNAAADSVGKTAAEQERAKATAQLLAAAEKDGTTVTAQMRAEIDKLAERAAAAAQALEKAKIAADIKFNRNTALLSAEDVQIATELKGLYPDVATALSSVEAQGIRVNNAMKGLSSSIENDLTSGLTDLVSGSKSAGAAFSDMSNTIIKAIEQMIIKITIVEPLMRSLQSAIGGSGLNIGSLLGGGGSAGAGAGTGLSLTSTGGLYHSGGIVGSEPTSLRDVHPSVFSGAPRFHSGGIAGDEVPIIARKGEGVFTAGQMAALGGRSGANVTVNVHNAPAGVQSQRSQTDANGNVSIDVILKKAIDAGVGDSMANGTGRRVLGSQFGIKPFMGQ